MAKPRVRTESVARRFSRGTRSRIVSGAQDCELDEDCLLQACDSNRSQVAITTWSWGLLSPGLPRSGLCSTGPAQRATCDPVPRSGLHLTRFPRSGLHLCIYFFQHAAQALTPFSNGCMQSSLRNSCSRPRGRLVAGWEQAGCRLHAFNLPT